MAKLVTIQRGQARNTAASTSGQTRSASEAASDSFSGLKLPFAVAFALVAFVCLGAAVLHVRSANSEHEFSLSQAHNQTQGKFSGILGVPAPILIGSAPGKSGNVGPK